VIDRPKQPELPPEVARAFMEDMRASMPSPTSIGAKKSPRAS
jgi:hypothetical protein